MVWTDLIPEARRLLARFAILTNERVELLHRLRRSWKEWDLAETDDADHAPTLTSDATVPAVRPVHKMPVASP